MSANAHPMHGRHRAPVEPRATLPPTTLRPTTLPVLLGALAVLLVGLIVGLILAWQAL